MIQATIQNTRPAIIKVDEVAPQSWRNGGGETRELLMWPAVDASWQIRISLADIERNGPFSAFPDTERWFAVVAGAGVKLSFVNDEKIFTHVITHSSAPHCFDGGEPPDCALIGGPTRDLNLMIRDGSGKMQRALDRLAWRTSAAQCGLFTMAAGFIHLGTEAIERNRSIGPIPANSLVWFDTAPDEPLVFETLHQSNQNVGWWLSFTPKAPYAPIAFEMHKP